MRAIDVANYFISLDTDGLFFNKKLISRNERTFYEGNCRLNKYLQLSLNVYLAMTGKMLFDEKLYAYDNGAVVLPVMNDYMYLIFNKNNMKFDIDEECKSFLNKMYRILSEASIDELIEISHEDDAWKDKCNCTFNEDEIMNPVDYINVYKKQYSDVIKIINSME